MSRSPEDVAAEALELEQESRAALAKQLLDSLPPPSLEESDAGAKVPFRLYRDVSKASRIRRSGSAARVPRREWTHTSLESLPDGRTRIVGTTWYQHRLWPALYWTSWSDAIIHRIHMRVLEHVKKLSEK